MSKLVGRELEFGKLIRPLFEHLPEIPAGEWHRFSFDVVQLPDDVQVASEEIGAATLARSAEQAPARCEAEPMSYAPTCIEGCPVY